MSQTQSENGMKKTSEGSAKWDDRFIKLAQFVGAWSKDPSTKVGSVIVRPDNTVAAMGYNGFPRGVLDHDSRYADKATKYEMVVHAEINALLNSRESLEGCTLYVTPLPPCAQCAAAIIQRGIKRVVVAPKRDLPPIWAEKFAISKTMFSESGIAVCELPEPARQEANDNVAVPVAAEAGVKS
jgi:dCMP deaminase